MLSRYITMALTTTAAVKSLARGHDVEIVNSVRARAMSNSHEIERYSPMRIDGLKVLECSKYDSTAKTRLEVKASAAAIVDVLCARI
jgi:hypothetical protein